MAIVQRTSRAAAARSSDDAATAPGPTAAAATTQAPAATTTTTAAAPVFPAPDAAHPPGKLRIDALLFGAFLAFVVSLNALLLLLVPGGWILEFAVRHLLLHGLLCIMRMCVADTCYLCHARVAACVGVLHRQSGVQRQRPSDRSVPPRMVRLRLLSSLTRTRLTEHARVMTQVVGRHSVVLPAHAAPGARVQRLGALSLRDPPARRLWLQHVALVRTSAGAYIRLTGVHSRPCARHRRQQTPSASRVRTTTWTSQWRRCVSLVVIVS